MKYDLIAEFRDGSIECFEYSLKNWNRYTGNNDVVAIVTARTEETVFERVIAHVCRWQKGETMKFKEYFVDDITYGMLVIGASMEETFDHILFCGDWDLALATARKDEGCLEYSLTFIDDDGSIGITAIKYGADWSIVFNRECDDAENLDEYPALANAFGEYIKQITIEYITK